MIADTLERLENYSSELKDLDKVLACLKTLDLFSLEKGKYPVPETEAYFQIQEYDTKLPGEGRFESHRKFTDIQCVLDGTEYIGWAPLEKGIVQEEYDENRDLMFYQDPEVFTKVILESGQFGVFFPKDLHMPGCAVDGRVRNRKLIIKIPVD